MNLQTRMEEMPQDTNVRYPNVYYPIKPGDIEALADRFTFGEVLDGPGLNHTSQTEGAAQTLIQVYQQKNQNAWIGITEAEVDRILPNWRHMLVTENLLVKNEDDLYMPTHKLITRCFFFSPASHVMKEAT